MALRSANPRQVLAVFLGLLILILMCTFPPVNRVYIFTETNASGEVLNQEEVSAGFYGYRYYLAPRRTEDGQEFRVATLILLAQVMLLFVIVRVVVISFRDQNAGIPGGRIFHQPDTK